MDEEMRNEEPREEDLGPKPNLPPVPENDEVPGDEPVPEEEYTSPDDATEHPEMDNTENDQNRPVLSPPVPGTVPPEFPDAT